MEDRCAGLTKLQPGDCLFSIAGAGKLTGAGVIDRVAVMTVLHREH